MEDPYAILGIPGTASPEEVRRAYARLVRRHPPESDPSSFARVRRAYEVLRDPARRQDHDAEAIWGDECRALVQEAEEHLHQGRPARATALLKRVLVLNRNLDPARRLLVRALGAQGRFREALREAERRISRSQEDLGPLCQAAWICYRWIEVSRDHPVRRRRLEARAHDLLDRAHQADPEHLGVRVVRAELYRLMDRPERALEWLDGKSPGGSGNRLWNLKPRLIEAALMIDRLDRRGLQACLRGIEFACLVGESEKEAGLFFVQQARKEIRRGSFHSLRWLIHAAEVSGSGAQEVRQALAPLKDLHALIRERNRIPPKLWGVRRLLGLEIELIRVPVEREAEILRHWEEVQHRVLEEPHRLRRRWARKLRESCPIFSGRNQPLLAALEEP